jgi:RNA polymerase sigma-70 factor, ECF subfamily
MPDAQPEVTVLLSKAREGDPDAFPRLVELIYPELRRLARHYMRGERTQHTLQPTALIHEAYLKIAAVADVPWRDRAHLVAASAQAMRRVLVDHARTKRADKRGEGEPLMELKDGLIAYAPEKAHELLEIEEALQRFEKSDPVKARIVELKFYGGLSFAEIAAVTGVSETTVARYWSAALARLKRDLHTTRSMGRKSP